MIITISHNNRKLGKIPSFSIPTRICPVKYVRKQGCDKYCYAKKMENRWSTIRFSYENNYEASLQGSFSSKMIKKLKWEADIFRIHVSGDFYSQEYLNKWIFICKAFPKKRFYCYTKALDLDFSKRPKNMNVILSDDNMIFPNHHKKFDGIATIIEPSSLKKQSLLWKMCGCSYQNGRGMTCDECLKCLHPGGLVVFKKH